MINRRIKSAPVEVLKSFDFFNDYDDTRCWALSACPEVVPALDAAHQDWLSARNDEGSQLAQVAAQFPTDILPGSLWIHHTGREYEVLHVANVANLNPKYPPSIVFRSVVNQNVWVKTVEDFRRTMTRKPGR